MTDDDAETLITAADEGPVSRDWDPRPYIAYNEKAKRFGYYVDVGRGGKENILEVPPEVYRDIIATLHLTLRSEILTVMDNIDWKMFADWVERVTKDDD